MEILNRNGTLEFICGLCGANKTRLKTPINPAQL